MCGEEERGNFYYREGDAIAQAGCLRTQVEMVSAPPPTPSPQAGRGSAKRTDAGRGREYHIPQAGGGVDIPQAGCLRTNIAYQHNNI